MNRKLWIGVAVSAVLLWLSAKDVKFSEAWEYVRGIDPVFLVPYLAIAAGEVVVRAFKWWLLLLPIKRTSMWKLSSATLIGLMANNVLPARAGEFVRAYVGSRMERVPLAASFATVVIDRVLDGLTVSAIFVLAILLHPLPDEVKLGGYVAAAIYVVALVFLVGLIVRESTTLGIVETVARRLPSRLGALLLRVARSFVGGLHVFRSPQLLLASIGVSIVIWIGYGLTLYFMFLAFDIHLSVLAAFVILLIVTILLTLPSSPGYFGAMELGISLGLRLVSPDMDQSLAFTFALVYHVTQYVPITVGGIVALWLERLTMSEITHVPAQVEQDPQEQPSAPGRR